MGIKHCKCISIRSVDYEESDLIVDLLDDSGKQLTAMVKGARKQESKYGAALDLLNLSELVYYEGENLVYPSQMELIENWEELKKRNQRIQSGLRCAKRVNGFIKEGQSEPGFYNLFKDTLKALDVEENVNWRSIEIGFYLKLIRLSGLRPSLDECSSCGREIDELDEIAFSPSLGSLVCGDCSRPGDSIPFSFGLRRSLKALEELPQGLVSRLKLSEKDYEKSLKILDRLSDYHFEL